MTAAPGFEVVARPRTAYGSKDETGLGGFVKAVDEDGFWESAIAHDVTR